MTEQVNNFKMTGMKLVGQKYDDSTTSTLTNGAVTGGGGVIAVKATGDVTVKSCKIFGGSSKPEAGWMIIGDYLNGHSFARVHISETSFACGRSATKGGCLAIYSTNQIELDSVDVSDCVVSSPRGVGGGALRITGSTDDSDGLRALKKKDDNGQFRQQTTS